MKFIKIIRTYWYENGQEAYNLEQKIIKDYSHAKYKGDSILKSGNSELFVQDILGWDI